MANGKVNRLLRLEVISAHNIEPTSESVAHSKFSEEFSSGGERALAKHANPSQPQPPLAHGVVVVPVRSPPRRPAPAR